MQSRISLIGVLVCVAVTCILVDHSLGTNCGVWFDR